MVILTQASQVENGDNLNLIIIGVILTILIIASIANKFKKAKNNQDGDTIEAIKETFTALFTEERFFVLADQCIEDSLNVLVKGSTKEQFIEDIKDNFCDALFNFIQTEYPAYKVVCSRDNIEKLADAILDNIGFNNEKIDTLYQEQIDKLNEVNED